MYRIIVLKQMSPEWNDAFENFLYELKFIPEVTWNENVPFISSSDVIEQVMHIAENNNITIKIEMLR